MNDPNDKAVDPSQLGIEPADDTEDNWYDRALKRQTIFTPHALDECAIGFFYLG